MKPYGVRIEEWPDVADIQNMAAKSACGCLQGKGGDYRGYNRNKAGKWRMRRMWKRIARRLGNREIQSQLESSIGSTYGSYKDDFATIVEESPSLEEYKRLQKSAEIVLDALESPREDMSGWECRMAIELRCGLGLELLPWEEEYLEEHSNERE